MNKLAYITYSQKEANRKIWNSLMSKYELLKKKNSALAYVWFPLACVLFGFIAVFSWLSSLSLFFKDIRFTPHYIQTVIDYNKMTDQEANTYLDSHLLEYKKRLSYGNISVKEKNSVDATFETLYNKYKLTESNLQDVISGISNIQESVHKTNTHIETVSQNIEPISTYADKKLKEEEQKKIILENKRQEQQNKIIADYDRARGRNLESFVNKLSDKQIDIFIEYCNQIPMFDIDVTKEDIKNLLSCTNEKPIQVRVNKHIALLFSKLAGKKLICSTWMGVAERYECFASRNGKPLNYKDLSTANATSSTIERKVEDLIEECIEEILKIKV